MKPDVDNTAPPPSLTLRGTLEEVYDGDTVTVSFTVKARIRMLDCWAPEVRTRSLSEKAQGLAAKRHLQSLVTTGTPVRVEIPLDGTTRLDDLFTMGRVLGTVWVGPTNLSAAMVASGHATAKKEA